MKQPSTKNSPSPVKSTIVLGRAAFTKISAVEGIALSPKSARLFEDFDRKGLPAEERRRILLEKHAKKA